MATLQRPTCDSRHLLGRLELEIAPGREIIARPQGLARSGAETMCNLCRPGRPKVHQPDRRRRPYDEHSPGHRQMTAMVGIPASDHGGRRDGPRPTRMGPTRPAEDVGVRRRLMRAITPGAIWRSATEARWRCLSRRLCSTFYLRRAGTPLPGGLHARFTGPGSPALPPLSSSLMPSRWARSPQRDVAVCRACPAFGVCTTEQAVMAALWR